MSSRNIPYALVVGLGLLLAACAFLLEDPEGSLLVNITGLPVGVDADVTVTGPDSFSQDLTGTQTLR